MWPGNFFKKLKVSQDIEHNIYWSFALRSPFSENFFGDDVANPMTHVWGGLSRGLPTMGYCHPPGFSQWEIPVLKWCGLMRLNNSEHHPGNWKIQSCWARWKAVLWWPAAPFLEPAAAANRVVTCIPFGLPGCCWVSIIRALGAMMT